MYPKQYDREDIRMLLGLESRRDETGLTYLLTPMDLYQIQQSIQIRPYTLRPEDPKCENGRERLRVIRPGNWTTQCTDVDAHGLGVTEFACVGLSVLTAEFALHPTVLGDDSTPCFFFDHQARMHDGLVLSGGSGGKKKCWQFFVSLICGVKATESKSDLWTPERVKVLQPVSVTFLHLTTSNFRKPATTTTGRLESAFRLFRTTKIGVRILFRFRRTRIS